MDFLLFSWLECWLLCSDNLVLITVWKCCTSYSCKISHAQFMCAMVVFLNLLVLVMACLANIQLANLCHDAINSAHLHFNTSRLIGSRHGLQENFEKRYPEIEAEAISESKYMNVICINFKVSTNYEIYSRNTFKCKHHLIC